MDVSSIAGPSPSGRTDGPGADAERVQLARLAHEFEAMFLSEMLRGMRESMLSDEQDEGLGADTMTDTFDGELGVALSKGGGLGLATVLLGALSRRGGGGDSRPAALSVVDELPVAPTEAAPDRDAAPASAGAPENLTTSFAPPGHVTSPFGWRADPFTGRQQFHAGTDIRMAYGQSVQAVAPGRVVSVGERSGYGLTVVVDHGDGLETRYAHLSAAAVQEGDVIAAGQVVAQSGNSGRSTGPHLHLEARQNGKAIEMAALLKETGGVADFYADRNYVRSGQ
jgi:murein DD-endopeptidase MepM/ murein hydrolase activator NlpD